MSDREMTPEYAALSFRAGLLAACIDAFLGTHEFSIRIHNDNWDLTEDYICALKRAAMERGVCELVLDQAEASAREAIRMNGFLARLIEMQRRVDGARKANLN